MGVTTLPGLRIERQFAQTIIHEDQTAASNSEFGKTERLRSEVKSDQSCRSGHGVKGLNRNSKMPKQNFYSEIQPGGRRCPQRVGYTCALSPDFLRLRRTEHVVFDTSFAVAMLSHGESKTLRLEDKPIHLSMLSALYTPISKKDRREFSASFR